MCQNGTGHRASSRSVQPLSGSAYRSRYTRLQDSGTITSGAVVADGIAAPPAMSQKRLRSSSPVSTRNACPWENPADGPRTALARIRSWLACDTGSVVNSRTMCRRRTTSWNSIVDSLSRSTLCRLRPCRGAPRAESACQAARSPPRPPPPEPRASGWCGPAAHVHRRVHLDEGGAILSRREGRLAGGRGGTRALGLLARGVHENRPGALIALGKRGSATVGELHRPDLDLDTARHHIVLDAVNRGARHARRDPGHVKQHFPGNIGRDRNGKGVVELYAHRPVTFSALADSPTLSPYLSRQLGVVRRAPRQSARVEDLEGLGQAALGEVGLGGYAAEHGPDPALQVVPVTGLALVRAQGGDLTAEGGCDVHEMVRHRAGHKEYLANRPGGQPFILSELGEGEGIAGIRVDGIQRGRADGAGIGGAGRLRG